MSLWARIQTLSEECQREIVCLYSENGKYTFPIEVRNLFAEVIEAAVCGENTDSVEKGLDPENPQHKDKIINFFSTLITKLEVRLGDSQSGDQFFTKHKLSEALEMFREKKKSDPLGQFDYMRNRIKAETALVNKQESPDFIEISTDRDLILENIQNIKAQVLNGVTVLKDIRSNENEYTLHVNKKRELEGQQEYFPQNLDSQATIRGYLSEVDGYIQQKIRAFEILIQTFETTITNNLDKVFILKGQIITEKLATWKHEQQQMANGIPKVHLVSLDKLQVWCEELADLIWHIYQQLVDVQLILQKGIGINYPAHIGFVQSKTEEVINALHDLLNKSMIVEEQPPQIIKLKTKFPKDVKVSMLVGKRLNIHMSSPELSAFFINEEQARRLPIADKPKTVGSITNGKASMQKGREEFKRITFLFRNMVLTQRVGLEKKGTNQDDRVNEDKSCLYFECVACVGPLKLKVSTISLPVAVITHGSQEALAVACISWDNAFGEKGREPFQVGQFGSWSEISKILKAKFQFQDTNAHGLTTDNIACMARKVFRNREPQPETITWRELCKEQLHGKKFTFWDWMFAALKLIEKKEVHLKEMWKRGLIMGFIEREVAENLIKRCKIGTFLIRFSDSFLAAITITVLVAPGNVVSLNPFRQVDLLSKPLALSIRDLDNLKYLYHPEKVIPKDDAFKDFYNIENAKPGNGYVKILPKIQIEESQNGNLTPSSSYNGSQRFSEGSLPGLESHSPFFAHPPYSPAASTNSMQEAYSPASASTSSAASIDTSHYETRRNTLPGFTFLSVNSPVSPASNQRYLETSHSSQPSPDNQSFQYSTDNEAARFHDLIRIIQRDGDVPME